MKEEKARLLPEYIRSSMIDNDLDSETHVAVIELSAFLAPL